jgi:hypothetical protein
MNSRSHPASWVLIQFLWWPLFCFLLTRPRRAVMICWNTVATTLNLSLRDDLFISGDWTDLVLVGCASREAGLSFLSRWRGRPVQPRVDEDAAVLLRSAPAKDSPGMVWLGEKTLPLVVLGTLRLSLSHLFPGVAAASIVGGMRFLTVHQLTVAACRYGCCITFFRALLVKVTITATHTTGRLLADRPYMVKFLAVVTAWDQSVFCTPRQFENLMGLWRPR